MATSPNNNLKKEIRRGRLFDDASPVLSSAVNINQGDLVVLTAGLLAPLSAGAEASLLGVSPVTIVAGKIQGPYTGLATTAAEAIAAAPGPVYGCEHDLILKTGDAFNPGDYVYPGADAQTVTSVAGLLKPVGHYVGPVVAAAAAGQVGRVLVGCRFPNDTLKY